MPKKENETQPLADQLEAQKAEETAAQDAASKVDVQADNQRGVGGAYVFDPKTGKRKRIAGPRVTLSTGEISDPAKKTTTAKSAASSDTETGGTQ